MGTLDCGQLLWERNEAFVLDAIKIVPDGLPGQVHTVGLTDGVQLVFGDLYSILVFVEVGETLRELHFKSRILPGFQGIVGLLVIFNGLGVVLGVGEAA